MLALNMLIVAAGQPSTDIPTGDIHGLMRLEAPHPQVGMPTRLSISMRNHTPGGAVPARPELPPEFFTGPWTIEPAEDANGSYFWTMVFNQTGQFTLPDIPIVFHRPEKALRPTGPMLRFIDGIRVMVASQEENSALAPPSSQPVAHFLALVWLATPACWFAWRLTMWFTWPGTREALRAKLADYGLPPGRHLPDQISVFWSNKGWPMNRIQRAIHENGPWPDPRPLRASAGCFWILWLAMGAL